MIALHLTATSTEHKLIKEYLEANVSEALAGKINNGIQIEKDGLRFINKKDLTTFMNYACEEARKQADKGESAACVGQDVVFGWAIHYFEEDALEGILYNEDGTEYKKPVPTKPKNKPIVKGKQYIPPAEAVKPIPKPQMSMFDIIADPAKMPNADTPNACDDSDADEFNEACNDIAEMPDDDADEAKPDEFEIDADADYTDAPEEQESEADGLIQISTDKYVDTDGVVHEPNKPIITETSALFKLFGGTLVLR